MHIERRRLIDDMLSSVGKLNNFEALFMAFADKFKKWNADSMKDNGVFDVIDFFSGCGGMSLGFQALPEFKKVFNILGAVDINQSALASYSKNFRSPVLNVDIRDLVADKNFNMMYQFFNLSQRSNPLIIIGCAPCQGFSAHGKRYRHREDKRNNLIQTFAEISIKLDPDYIVMENVPEIFTEKYWEFYKQARELFIKRGYKINQTVYNAASFGVPQSRNRAVIVASKKSYELPVPVLTSEHYNNVRSAIGDLPAINAGETSILDSFHRSANHRKETVGIIASVPKNGGNRPSGIGPKCLDKVKGFYDVYGRLSWDKPSITITQYSRNPASGRFSHPEQNRGLSIREAARLQSFPDSFIFDGSLDACFKQIGEAVPPLLSLAIATSIMINESSFAHIGKQLIKSVTEPVSSSYSCEIEQRLK